MKLGVNFCHVVGRKVLGWPVQLRLTELIERLEDVGAAGKGEQTTTSSFPSIN